MQNVRANVKVMKFQSLCIFSCILTLLIILIKPRTTKAHNRCASGDCGTSGLTCFSVISCISQSSGWHCRSYLIFQDTGPSRPQKIGNCEVSFLWETEAACPIEHTETSGESCLIKDNNSEYTFNLQPLTKKGDKDYYEVDGPNSKKFRVGALVFRNWIVTSEFGKESYSLIHF